MSLPLHVRNILLIAVFALVSTQGVSQSENSERHVRAAMRMIGHQMLLHAGDSTSRVLPIEKIKDQYKISFATEFPLVPDDLVAIVDSVVEATGIANAYQVEVVQCDSIGVVYSYEIGLEEQEDIVACRARGLPSGCYQVLFNILEKAEDDALAVNAGQPNKDMGGNGERTNYMFFLLLIPASLLFGSVLYFKRKRQKASPGNDGILIGEYRFDKRNMMLTIQDQKLELTSKEADLLYLLHASANDTVEREVMLKEVWGDEGDYVGRTLDVFISKLRKKLEADPSVRIANIRGVGYKLILND